MTLNEPGPTVPGVPRAVELLDATPAATVIVAVLDTVGLLPRFVDDAVGLAATMSLLSLFLWSRVLGPIGAILTLLVKALQADSDPRAGWVDAMVGSLPWKEKVPHERRCRRPATARARRRHQSDADHRRHPHAAGT